MASAELDLSSGVPLYRQIKDILRAEIADDPLAAEHPITEARLLARFDVSRAPIRQALKELTVEGYVYRKQGKGTYPVAGTRINRPADVRPGGLYRYLSEHGANPSSKVSGLSRVIPPADVAVRLGCAPGELLLHFDRTISVNAQPVSHNTLYFRVPADFTATPGDLAEGTSILDHLEKRYGITVERSEHEARAIAATAEQASVLDVPPMSPLLAVTTTFFATGGVPIGWRSAAHRGEEFAFSFVTNP